MNIKKTLADVRPGGRVRLGDQAELDRLEFQAWARSIGACVDADEHGNYVDSHLNSAKLGWSAALAARQPVGVPTAWMHTHKATGRVEFGLSPMYDCDFNAEKWDSVALYTAHQPVGEVSVKKEDANNYCLILRALGMEEEGDPVAEVQALVEARDRQPVGEPVGYFDPDVLAHLTEGLIDPVGVLRRKPNGKSNVPVWLGPPAQAVDLGQLKRFELFADEGPGLGGMSVDYEESDTGAWVRFDDLKALIDNRDSRNG